MRELLRIVWTTTITFPVFYHFFYLLYIINNSCIFIVVCTKLRETLAKTQYLPTSFAQRLLQGRRIYRFISICELCLQLENLMLYKWIF